MKSLNENQEYIDQLYKERMERLIFILVERHNYLQNELRLEDFIVNKYDKIKQELENQKKENLKLNEDLYSKPKSKSETEYILENKKLKKEIDILKTNNLKLSKNLIEEKNTRNIIYVEKKQAKFNYNGCLPWWNNLLYSEKIKICESLYGKTYTIPELKEIIYIDIKNIYKDFKESKILL